MSKVIGIDYGKKRIGIAISDIDQKNKASITTGFPASETIDSQYEFLDQLQGWKKKLEG